MGQIIWFGFSLVIPILVVVTVPASPARQSPRAEPWILVVAPIFTLVGLFVSARFSRRHSPATAARAAENRPVRPIALSLLTAARHTQPSFLRLFISNERGTMPDVSDPVASSSEDDAPAAASTRPHSSCRCSRGS